MSRTQRNLYLFCVGLLIGGFLALIGGGCSYVSVEKNIHISGNTLRDGGIRSGYSTKSEVGASANLEDIVDAEIPVIP